jgi:large subunit ribosomal protein L11
MAKKIKGYIKLQAPAQDAKPGPPVGPMLGAQGVNIMEFCKGFNAQTQSIEKGTPIPVVITVYEDRSFTFVLKTPPVSYFILKAAKLPKGAQTAGKGGAVGKITKKQAEEIANQKMKDLNANDLAGAVKMVIGSARSMGVEVEG